MSSVRRSNIKYINCYKMFCWYSVQNTASCHFFSEEYLSCQCRAYDVKCVWVEKTEKKGPSDAFLLVGNLQGKVLKFHIAHIAWKVYKDFKVNAKWCWTWMGGSYRLRALKCSERDEGTLKYHVLNLRTYLESVSLRLGGLTVTNKNQVISPLSVIHI